MLKDTAVDQIFSKYEPEVFKINMHKVLNHIQRNTYFVIAMSVHDETNAQRTT